MRLQIILSMAEKCVPLLKDLVRIPAPVAAFIRKVNHNDNLHEIISCWEERDLSRLDMIKFQKTHVVNVSNLDLITSTFPVELNKELLRAYSSIDNKIAILRSVSNKEEADKQYLEIWDNNSKIKSIDLCSQEKHLKVHADGYFGSLKWSPCGSRLLYIAEKYYKGKSWFKTISKSDDQIEKNIIKGEEFLYRETWGEALNHVHLPTIFIINVETEEITQVSGIGDEVSCGQAVWTPDSNGIVFVGWDHTPFRLGLIYCNNRRSAIYHADLISGVCRVIGSATNSVEFPRFSSDGTFLVFMQSLSEGPHRNTQCLVRCDWQSKEVQTVVDCIHHVEDSEKFPGIYAMSLPDRIWLSDNKKIVISSIWRSKQELVIIDVSTGAVNRLTNDPEYGDWSLLDVFDDYVVVVSSSPSRRSSLVLGKVISDKNCENIRWINLDKVNNLPTCNLKWEIMRLQPPIEHVNQQHPKLDFEALLVLPSVASQPHPLIVLPHGGPHSAITAAYNMTVEYFCRLGFAVLLVNYRGSIGFGQDSLESLLGHIGTQDVADVTHAVNSAINSGKVDANRMVLYGGSHGGFLVLSLAGLYPDVYKACVARNPVVDIGGMAGATDIPDWNYVESGLKYNHASVPHSIATNAMWERSPIHLVDKIKIPVLFTLGRVDLRVPYQQGLQMYKALRARNVETRVYMYDDNHPLKKVEVEADGLINCAQWMLKYIS